MVLVAGVIPLRFSASAELYDLASGTWTFTGSLNTTRYLHTATLLPNGMVLAAAGIPQYFCERGTVHSWTNPNAHSDAKGDT